MSESRLGISLSRSRILSTAPGGQVLRDAAGTDVRVVHPQAGDHLEHVEDQLALAEAERHRR